jgi:hypothetical protein
LAPSWLGPSLDYQLRAYHSQMFVPANKKWYRNLVVARTIADTLEALNPRYPAAETGLDKVEIPD